ncbi:hypothetical protein ACQGS5_28455, partial [Bacillus sp. GKis3/1]
MAKTPGLLGRKKRNFEPTEPYVPKQGQAAIDNNAEATAPSQPKTEEKQVTRKAKRNEKTKTKKEFK